MTDTDNQCLLLTVQDGWRVVEEVSGVHRIGFAIWAELVS